ncbi:TetR/AcrR family transcriptional regulator [Streptococcus hongkongensis]|nr:TetR family transcriptional regulator [Streptococcus uberis]
MSIRQTHSKESIVEAFIQLMQEKDLEAISISELTKKANLNRGTFYLHYQDKYDLLDQLKTDLFNRLFSILDHKTIYTDTTRILEKTLQEFKHHLLLVTALSRSSHLDFRKTLSDFIYSVLISIDGYQIMISESYQMPFDYGLEVYISTIIAIISLWVSNGCQEDPKQITNYILTTIKMP